jgi:hypothetical protein
VIFVRTVVFASCGSLSSLDNVGRVNEQTAVTGSKARWFVRQLVDGGPAWLAEHLPAQFVVGMPSGSTVIDRDGFIEAAKQRAALVNGMGLPAPTLGETSHAELGSGYLIVTATWTMPGPDGDTLTLMEDFLIDRTGPEWMCLSYLLRQDLPGLLGNR